MNIDDRFAARSHQGRPIRLRVELSRMKMPCMDCTIRTMRRDEIAIAIEFAALEG